MSGATHDHGHGHGVAVAADADHGHGHGTKAKKKKQAPPQRPCVYCPEEMACQGVNALNMGSRRKDKRTPMTLLSGFLGAGKTTLLENVLQNRLGIKVAVIVNDLGSVNVDGQAVKKLGLDQNDEKVVELSNGCMCCGLKDDLLKEINDVAKSGKYDVLLVEGSGVAEPMPVAEGISNFDIGRGKTLADIIHLDTIVTVVDTPNFLENYNSQQSISERPDLDKSGNAGHTPVVSLMVEQIEFANVVVLNKQAEVSAENLAAAEGIVAGLNPGAKVFKTNFSQLCPKDVLCTDLFDFNTAEDMPGWAALQDPSWIPKVASCAIRHALYKREKPFHPSRLRALLADGGPSSVPRKLGLSRSKGVFWLATRSEVVGQWQHAGALYRYMDGGSWDEAGERRQELVLIGPGLDTAALEKELDKCLLTDEEMEQKIRRRTQRAPPKPKPSHGHGHGHGGHEREQPHHHGHGHDADGNCVDLDDDANPYNWWHEHINDDFPAFEVDCCANGQVCEKHDGSDDSDSDSDEPKIAEGRSLSRSELGNAKQQALADATFNGDLSKMEKMLGEDGVEVGGTTKVDLEVEEDGDVNSQQWAALHIAARAGQREAAALLLDHGADVNGAAEDGLTALMCAVVGAAPADLVGFLLERGASTAAIGPCGATALHFACEQENEECVVTLIKAGADMDAKDEEGCTPAEVAEESENETLLAAMKGAVKSYRASQAATGSTTRKAARKATQAPSQGSKRRKASKTG